MMPFAVWHEGMAEGTGKWVMAIDSKMSRFLLVGEEREFYWRPMADCQLARVVTPENPRLVIPVQPQQQQGGIVLPNLTNGHR